MNTNYHASSLERLPSRNFSAAAEVKKSRPRPSFGNRPFTRSWFPAASGGNLRHSSTPGVGATVLSMTLISRANDTVPPIHRPPSSSPGAHSVRRDQPPRPGPPQAPR